MKIPFTKAHGAKNDFLLTWRADAPEGDRAAMARAICHRHTGVGADGWIVVTPPVDAEAEGAIELYNSDGSTAEISGKDVYKRQMHFMAPGYLLDTVFDPTGAGDCFAGGFIGYLAGRGIGATDVDLNATELRRAVIYGSVMGSFCCEQFGLDRFRTLRRDEIDARYREFLDCTAF